MSETMTADQAADYLQVDRDTIYRYIREGKLLASRLGRSYRIPRRNLELLLWATRTRPDITLREYGADDVAEFLRLDELDEVSLEMIRRFEAGLANNRP
jgi:excisionase family DNA binding protein